MNNKESLGQSSALDQYVRLIIGGLSLYPVDMRVVDKAIKSILETGKTDYAKSLLEMRTKMDGTSITKDTADRLIKDSKEYYDTYKDEIKESLKGKPKDLHKEPDPASVKTTSNPNTNPAKNVEEDKNKENDKVTKGPNAIIKEQDMGKEAKQSKIIGGPVLKKLNFGGKLTGKGIEDISFDDLPKTSNKTSEPVMSNKEANTPKAKSEAQKRFEEREQLLTDIAKFLKEGVDRIVIHGKTIEVGDDIKVEPKFGEHLDIDTKVALLLFGNAKGKNGKELIRYNENSYTEIVEKGGRGGKQNKTETYIDKDGKEISYPVSWGRRKAKKDETILYIDTSGEKLSVKMSKNGKGKEIHLDHHQEYFSKYPTSAAELAFEVRKKLNALENGNASAIESWEEKLAYFTTEIDNLTYVEHKNYSEKFLRDVWPGSLYALSKEVPFEKLVKWFKEGKDIINPNFSKEELNEFIEKRTIKGEDGKEIEKDFTLLDIIKLKHEEIGIAFSKVKTAIELQEIRGIGTESAKIGKFIYNKRDRQTEIRLISKDKNMVNVVNYGFLVAKSLGYDSYVEYYDKYKRYMINNITANGQTGNLENIIGDFRKVVPGTILVRGVMLFQPQKTSERENMTEEKLLELIGAGKPKTYEEIKKSLKGDVLQNNGGDKNLDEEAKKKEEERLEKAKQEQQEKIKSYEEAYNKYRETLKSLEGVGTELEALKKRREELMKITLKK